MFCAILTSRREFRENGYTENRTLRENANEILSCFLRLFLQFQENSIQEIITKIFIERLWVPRKSAQRRPCVLCALVELHLCVRRENRMTFWTCRTRWYVTECIPWPTACITWPTHGTELLSCCYNVICVWYPACANTSCWIELKFWFTEVMWEKTTKEQTKKQRKSSSCLVFYLLAWFTLFLWRAWFF
jgi:hypothetical protein